MMSDTSSEEEEIVEEPKVDVKSTESTKQEPRGRSLQRFLLNKGGDAKSAKQPKPRSKSPKPKARLAVFKKMEREEKFLLDDFRFKEVLAAVPLMLLRGFQKQWVSGAIIDTGFVGGDPFPVYGIPNAFIDAGLITLLHVLTYSSVGLNSPTNEADIMFNEAFVGVISESAYKSIKKSDDGEDEIDKLRADFDNFCESPWEWADFFGILKKNVSRPIQEQLKEDNFSQMSFEEKFVLYVKMMNDCVSEEKSVALKDQRIKALYRVWRSFCKQPPDTLLRNFVANINADSSENLEFAGQTIAAYNDRGLIIENTPMHYSMILISQAVANFAAANIFSAAGLLCLGSLVILSRKIMPTWNKKSIPMGLFFLTRFGVNFADENLPAGIGGFMDAFSKAVGVSGEAARSVVDVVTMGSSPMVLSVFTSMPYINMLEIAIIKQTRIFQKMGLPEKYVSRAAIAVSGFLNLFIVARLSREDRGKFDLQVGKLSYSGYIELMMACMCGVTMISLIYEICAGRRDDTRDSGIKGVKLIIPIMAFALGESEAFSVRDQFYATGFVDNIMSPTYALTTIFTVVDVAYHYVFLDGQKPANKKEALEEVVRYYGEDLVNVTDGPTVFYAGMYKVEIPPFISKGVAKTAVTSYTGEVVDIFSAIKRGLWRGLGRVDPEEPLVALSAVTRAKISKLIDFENTDFIRITYATRQSLPYLMWSENAIARNKDMLAIWFAVSVSVNVLNYILRSSAFVDNAYMLEWTTKYRMLYFYRARDLEYLDYDFTNNFRALVDYAAAKKFEVMGLSDVPVLLPLENRPAFEDIKNLIDEIDFEVFETMWGKAPLKTIKDRLEYINGQIAKIDKEFQIKDSDSRVDMLRSILKVVYSLEYTVFTGIRLYEKHSFISIFVYLLLHKSDNDLNPLDINEREAMYYEFPKDVEVKAALTKGDSSVGETLQLSNLIALSCMTMIASYPYVMGRQFSGPRGLDFLKQPNSRQWMDIKKAFEPLGVAAAEFVIKSIQRGVDIYFNVIKKASDYGIREDVAVTGSTAFAVSIIVMTVMYKVFTRNMQPRV